VHLAKGQYYFFGGLGMDQGKSIIVCANQDLMLLGSTSSDVEQAANVYLMRVDTNMQCIWSLSLGGHGIEQAISIVETEEEEFLILGNTSDSDNNGYDIALWKVDAEGEILWQTQYGDEQWNFANRLIKGNANDYWITGYTINIDDGTKDPLLLHLSEVGEELQYLSYVTESDDDFVDLDILDNGTILLSGNTCTSEDVCTSWIKILDNSGALLDFNTFGNDDLSTIVTETILHGQYIVHCGHTVQNGIPSSYLRRLNSDGTLNWEQIEAYSQEETYLSVIEYGGHYYIATESYVSSTGDTDGIIYRRNEGGWYQDAHIIQTNLNTGFFDLVFHPNGDLFAIGYYTTVQQDIAFLIYKHNSTTLVNDLNLAIIPTACFTVGLEEFETIKSIDSTQFYNWMGQKLDATKLPACYIRIDYFTDGTIATQKICGVAVEGD
jgi:hypothetical protein